MRHLGIFCIAAFVSLVLAFPLRWLALARGMTDRPAPHKFHRRPTPYLGGIAVTAAAIVCTAALLRPWPPMMFVLILGAVSFGLIGLADDIKPIRPATRLGAEAAIAICVTSLGVRAPLTGIDWFDAVLSAGWLMIISNSMNLLDNADGAFPAIATASSAGLAVGAIITGEHWLAVLLLATSGATAGFLVHNWPPARMFLGDAGSLFLGFLLVVAAFRLSSAAPDAVGALAWLLLAALPALVDTTVVVVSRIRAGRSILTGGTDHLSHRLRRLGLSARVVAVASGAFAGVACSAGLLILANQMPASWGIAGAIATWCCLSAVALILPATSPTPLRIPAPAAELTVTSSEYSVDSLTHTPERVPS